jgi:hypothetical protein
MSRGLTATDETKSSDSWSHVTRGDGLNEMVQYIECTIYSPLVLVTPLVTGGYPPGHVASSIPGNPHIHVEFGKGTRQWTNSPVKL